MKKFVLIYLIICSLCFACNSKQEQPKPIVSPPGFKEKMEKANTYLSHKENDEILGYISRRGWKMDKTVSGVYYWIYEKGEGLTVKSGEMVKLKYTLGLINGMTCYSSENDKLLDVNVGKYEVTGLSQVLVMMNRGDKAKIIVPSHLGYGLMGDDNCIPARATLIYDIEIL